MAYNPLTKLFESLKYNDAALLKVAKGFVKSPASILTSLRGDNEVKKNNFQAYETMIRENLHDALREIPKTQNKEQKECVNWDYYMLLFKISFLKISRNLVNAFQPLVTLTEQQLENFGCISKGHKENLLEVLESFATKFIIRSGLGTAFDLFSGLLRVIPILWKQKYNSDISKDQLIAVLSSAKTKSLIDSIANMHTNAMTCFTNLLWCLPQEIAQDMEGLINRVDQENSTNDTNPIIQLLFDPGNFALSTSDNLIFTKQTAKLHNEVKKYAAENTITESLGCPALRVECIDPATGEKEKAITVFCNHISDLIRLIPDEQFATLIQAEPLSHTNITKMRDMQEVLLREAAAAQAS